MSAYSNRYEELESPVDPMTDADYAEFYEIVHQQDTAAEPADDGAKERADTPSFTVEVQSIEEFAAVDEPGADALVGDEKNNLVPENGDAMFYGDGGAGKTTLTTDLACHLGSGTDWLGFPIDRPVRVLIIEAEGPRPLLRQKLRRKLDAWDADIDGRVSILSSPWAAFTFASNEWRATLARVVNERQIDVIIAGPLTRIGMDAAGTLQEVVAFMALVANVRAECNRRIALILVHHENKGGAVSGAWEGAGDTLLHIQAAGAGQTVMHVQKARWGSDYHGKTFKLTWASGEGFELVGERDLLADIQALVSDGGFRTLDEIRKQVGAGTETVRKAIDDNADHFAVRTGNDAVALGRSRKAVLYGTVDSTRLTPESSGVESTVQGAHDRDSTTRLPL